MKNSSKTRKLFVRLSALALILCLALASLVGCGGKAASTELTPGQISADALDEGTTLDATQLNRLAEVLGKANGKTFAAGEKTVAIDTRTMLAAAERGYNMLDPAFDDAALTNGANVPAEKRESDLAAAVLLIDKAKEAVNLPVDFDYSALNEKDLHALVKAFGTSVEMNEKVGLIDRILGWVGAFLGWLTNTIGFGSYVLGIFIFAIVVEILLLPFAVKQQKNSIKQATLRPKEMAIRKKYAGRNDQATQQKINTEIQELYQKENFSPFSGCLPLLLQMPIILALYNVVVNPLQYVLGQAKAVSAALSTFASTARAAGGLGMSLSTRNGGTIGLLARLRDSFDVLEGLKDFSFFSNGDAVYDSVSRMSGKIPNFMLGNLNLGETPSFNGNAWLLLVPVLTFIVYFGSMKLTKKFMYQPTTGENDRQAACSNNIMDFSMPAISVYFTFLVPALVGVYWMFKSVVSTARQFIMCKIMPYPKFTEEDYKQAEREYAGKAPRKSTQTYSYSDRQMVGGKPKSLFHMDDDDYVAKIEEEQRREEEENAARAAKGAKSADSHGVTRADLKDDSKKK